MSLASMVAIEVPSTTIAALAAPVTSMSSMTGLRTSDQDTGAERRRGIADDPEAGQFRTGYSGGDDSGAAFRRGAG